MADDLPLDSAATLPVQAGVLLYGDPALRERARPVGEVDDGVRALVDQLRVAMAVARGQGLAAPQLGVLRRVVVYTPPDAPAGTPARALVDPQVVEASDEREVFLEGCLSIPGLYVEVERPARVVVEARDEHGAPLRIDGEGEHASVLQHELDHLDGVMLPDRLEGDARRAALRELHARSRAGWPVGRPA